MEQYEMMEAEDVVVGQSIRCPEDGHLELVTGRVPFLSGRHITLIMDGVGYHTFHKHDMVYVLTQSDSSATPRRGKSPNWMRYHDQGGVRPRPNDRPIGD